MPIAGDNIRAQNLKAYSVCALKWAYISICGTVCA